MVITLKNLRRRAGLTQKEAAELLHTSNVQISKWENRLCIPRPHWITELANIYKCSADEVMDAIYPQDVQAWAKAVWDERKED